jgi:hypothetical protein
VWRVATATPRGDVPGNAILLNGGFADADPENGVAQWNTLPRTSIAPITIVNRVDNFPE